MSADVPVPSVDELLAHAEWVRALARSLVRDDTAAEDVVQQTWLAAIEHPPRADRPLRPWLAEVVRNFARMRVRDEAHRREREQLVSRAEEAPATAHSVERTEIQRRIARAVLALEEPLRSTVLLRYFEGLSSAEIARRTRTPAGTVRWRLMRGLEQLRRALDAQHDGKREAWVGLVLPIADAAEHLAPRAGTGSAPVSAATKLGAVAGFAALALLVPIAVSFVRDQSESRPALAPPASSMQVAGARSTALASDPRTAEQERVAASGTNARAAVVASAIDASGRALPGARLRVRSRDDLEAIEDANGRLELAWPASERDADGLLEFELSAQGFVSRVVRAATMRGEATYLGAIELERACRVEGSVADASGRALAGASVRFEILPSRWRGLRQLPLEEARWLGSMLDVSAPRASADADGRFAASELPAGYVRAWAGADGYAFAYSEPIALRGGETLRDLRFALEPLAERETIEGLVLGPDARPVAFAEVEAIRHSVQGLFFRGERAAVSARADEHGRFRIGVEPGKPHDLAARDADGRWRPAVQRRAMPGARDIVIALAPWTTIELHVRDAEGAPVSGWRAELFDADGVRALEPETLAARAGPLRVPHVPFALRVACAGYETLDLGRFEPSSAPGSIECTLVALPRARGRVTADGRPVANARVTLLRAEPRELARAHAGFGAGREPLCSFFRPDATVATDERGEFRSFVAREPCALRVEADGWAPLVIELAPERESALTRGGALEGRVLANGNGDPAGTVVGITCGDGFLRTARVGPSGEFRFEHLAHGSWQVRAVKEETAARGWEALGGSEHGIERSRVHFDCAVLEGATTRFDVDLAREAPCCLTGRLLFDGASPGPWRVRAVALSSDGFDEGGRAASGVLDTDGRFRICAARAGRYELSLWDPAAEESSAVVREELELVEGANDWRLDVPTARLAGEIAPEARAGELALEWQGGGGASVSVPIRPDADGRFELQRAPAGLSRVVRRKAGSDGSGGESVVLELDLRAGTTAHALISR